jgi:glycosyltransferase involved in cell wall biosynthesis
VIVAYNALSVRPLVADGAATFSINLLHRLPEALPEARIVAFVRAGEDRLRAAEGVEVRPLSFPAGAAGRIAVETFRLSGDLRRVGADVLLSPNESLPVRTPCPVVVVAQNLVYHRGPGTGTFTGAGAAARAASVVQFAYYRRRMRDAYRRAAAVIAVSEETKRVLAARAGLDPAKTAVVHEGADSILLPCPRGDRRRELRLLVVSAWSPYKGLERTLEVHAALRRSRPELALELVGSDWRGFRRVLEREVHTLGITDAVRFREGVAPEELAELYETSALLVSLSACESFGLPLVEGMRYGLPVVAAARSSLPEVVGGAGLLVDPDRPDDAVERVGALLDDDAARAELGRRGRERAAQLTWQRTAEGVAAVLRRSGTLAQESAS